MMRWRSSACCVDSFGNRAPPVRNAVLLSSVPLASRRGPITALTCIHSAGVNCDAISLHVCSADICLVELGCVALSNVILNANAFCSGVRYCHIEPQTCCAVLSSSGSLRYWHSLFIVASNCLEVKYGHMPWHACSAVLRFCSRSLTNNSLIICANFSRSPGPYLYGKGVVSLSDFASPRAN